MGRVQDKVALITGAASGLGAEDARVLAREGAKVVITDIQDEMGEAVAAEIGENALYLNHDVRSEARWQQVIDTTIARFGKLDILVNNAGLVHFQHVEDLPFEHFKLETDVMLSGAFLGCKYAIPVMTKGGDASIINVASIGAIKGLSGIPAYAAAKGGMIAMTRSIAVHCKEQKYGIRVNSIAPGNTVTPMIDQAMEQVEADAPGLRSSIEAGMGQPADVANLVLFLASEESRRITGTNIVIDNAESIE
ncbi:MAG: SDR family oxidoreductase [Pseudomonadota bacterium]